MKVNGHNIDISNRDKVLFTEKGISKGDLIDYYAAIAPVMLPHIRTYPISMQRFPDGIGHSGFFNKNTPDYFPQWIDRVKFPKVEGGSFQAPVIDTEATLVYCANQAMITAHLYLAERNSLQRPDRMIFDLDPPDTDDADERVRRAARDLHALLNQLELVSWIQTTGSSGYHIIVPLKGSLSFDEVRDFAKDVARILVCRDEDSYTLEQRKDARGKRIFIDVLRNAYGATAVAPYTVRALPGAPVATPLDWDELQSGVSPQQWNISNIRQRLGQKTDPWENMLQHRFELTSYRDAVTSLLDKFDAPTEGPDSDTG
ncbi:non-homologous end-joining DNA ligase [Aliidiomarina sp. Khilg15.8]